ncbi:MAG TPA: trehalose-phosphatase [Candidatus Margulisbacteria bacterium]|nr:MAG: trehalose-phosphatase [Candidatus Margulisbacteria bacterium GWD2_39_127]OGI09198.1 MAG: trehalose-phosphatase [Candidatus Margulisbacteria bacterium GWE2_39_32]HAR63078.1 trehalose-phosphatase [Candidatus Margulisiibacteriota bacterium]HCT84504.1 trehalose-phosphatase [Candidatus Margulisiibacteriota bacterium]
MAELLNDENEKKIIEDYKKSEKRILFLDYDGTLVSFYDRPGMAKPDEALTQLLRDLSFDVRNKVFIISGRNRYLLGKWLNNFNIGLSAEHGAWLKYNGDPWQTLIPIDTAWKKDLRPIFELYADTTPGSYVEEKDFSIAWHYRKTYRALSDIRVKELRRDMLPKAKALHLQILEGQMVLEVKNPDVNKGLAALRFMSDEAYDFSFSAGDDRTDEDMFKLLPPKAYSIKVGNPPTAARYYVRTYSDLRSLLHKLLRAAN